MGKREQLQAGITSAEFRIAATAQNFADEPSEKQGGDGSKYARKLAIYGKAVEILRRELEILDDLAPAPEDPANVPTITIDEQQELRRRGFGVGWR